MKETIKRQCVGLGALGALILMLAAPLAADFGDGLLERTDLEGTVAPEVAFELPDSESMAMIGGFGGDLFGDDCLAGFFGLGIGLLAGAVIAASGGTALVLVAIAGAYAPVVGIAIC